MIESLTTEAMRLKTVLSLTILSLSIWNVRANDMFWIEAGDRAFANQQISISIDFYTKALEDNPRQVLALIRRSKAYKATGQFIKSAEDLALAYQVDPVYFESYMRTSANIANRSFPETDEQETDDK